MSTFLFVSFPERGHLNSLLTIAGELKSEGHKCIFAFFGPDDIAQTIKNNGFEIVSIKPSLLSFEIFLLPYTSGFWETFFALNIFYSGILTYANHIIPVIEKYKPEVLITDFAIHGSCLAAEKMKIPFVTIYSAGLYFKGKGVPPLGSGLPIGKKLTTRGKIYRFLMNTLEKHILRKTNRARKKLGLTPHADNSLDWLCSPWLNFCLTSETIEAPRSNVPKATYFIGPCYQGRKDDDDKTFPFEKLDKKKKKIFVSMGSIFNKKPKLFQKVIDAFKDSNYQLIISAGFSLETLKAQNPPSNVLLFKRVPQLKLLPHVDLVISHGGNNTTNETLAAGKPLLVMPFGGEQHDNAARVVYIGAGLRADLKKSSSEEIKKKAHRILTEKSFLTNTKKIKKELDKTQANITAATFIKHLASSKEKLSKPKGYPLTVTKDMPPPWKWEK